MPTHDSVKVWFALEIQRLGDSLKFNPDDIANDLVATAQAFPDPVVYQRAMQEVLHQIDVIRGTKPGIDMKHGMSGWRRHAFQSDRHARGTNADLRIVYRQAPDGAVEIFGFGHRRIPYDVYLRLRKRLSPP